MLIVGNREPETQRNARLFGSSMAEWQHFGCLATWPCNCKQTLSLRFPIDDLAGMKCMLLWVSVTFLLDDLGQSSTKESLSLLRPRSTSSKTLLSTKFWTLRSIEGQKALVFFRKKPQRSLFYFTIYLLTVRSGKR